VRDFRETSLRQCLQGFPACQRSQSAGPNFLSGKVYILCNYYTELHSHAFPIGHSTPGFILRCEVYCLAIDVRKAVQELPVASRQKRLEVANQCANGLLGSPHCSLALSAFTPDLGSRGSGMGMSQEMNGDSTNAGAFSLLCGNILVQGSVEIDAKLRPLTYRSNHPVSLTFSSSRQKRPKPPLPVSLEIVSDAWQAHNFRWSLRLRNLASRQGFTPNDFTFRLNVPREPDHVTLGRPAPSVFQSSTGEVHYLRVYLCPPSSPSVPAYRYFCTRDIVQMVDRCHPRGLRNGLPAHSRWLVPRTNSQDDTSRPHPMIEQTDNRKPWSRLRRHDH